MINCSYTLRAISFVLFLLMQMPESNTKQSLLALVSFFPIGIIALIYSIKVE